jgi:hypothetical protein
MTDQFPPPGWFPQPAIWPYWPSLKDGFALPQAPSDPWNQPDGNWGQQSGTNAGATTSQSNDAWDQRVPAWLRLAVLRIPSGGILGSFPQQNDAPDESTTPSPGAGRGILAPLERWNPFSSNTGQGILAPLERLNIAGEQTSPAWLQSRAPFVTNTGSLSSSIVPPWDYSQAQGPSAWENAPKPPSFHPPAPQYAAEGQSDSPGTIAPPQQHFESANYWGAGPTPNASGQVPSNSFYLSPVPHALSWDSVPTYPSGNQGQISSGPPDPTSWDASAPWVPAGGNSTAYEAALAQEARDVAAERFAKERRAAIARLAEPREDDPRSILVRMMDGAQTGAGGGELGISRENIEKYPALEMLQIPARMADTVPRAIGATIGGLTGLGAGLAEFLGMSRVNADRLQRDLNIGGMLAALLAGEPQPRPGVPHPGSRGRADTNAKSFDRAAVVNELPPRSQYGKEPLLDEAFRPAKQDELQVRPTIETPSEARLGEVPSASGGPFNQRLNREGTPPAARTHLTDDEAREVINAFRTKELDKQGEFFPDAKKEEGVVAVTNGESKNEFGVNSTSSAYTPKDQIEADRLRAKLIKKYPEMTDRGNIGWRPNDALYHAETTLLLKLAGENGGSLAGRELVIHTDGEMCPSCRKLLPYIGLELGNPTVTFIDNRGRRLIMHDGKPLHKGKAP